MGSVHPSFTRPLMRSFNKPFTEYVLCTRHVPGTAMAVLCRTRSLRCLWGPHQLRERHEKAPVGWRNDGGPGCSQGLQRRVRWRSGCLGLVLEGEDSEVAQGLWLGCWVNADLLLASWTSFLCLLSCCLLTCEMGVTVTPVGNVKRSSENPGQVLMGQTVECRLAAACTLGMTVELSGSHLGWLWLQGKRCPASGQGSRRPVGPCP